MLRDDVTLPQSHPALAPPGPIGPAAGRPSRPIPSGPTGGQTGGIMAVIDALFEQDALAGLTTENRAKRDRALAGV